MSHKYILRGRLQPLKCKGQRCDAIEGRCGQQTGACAQRPVRLPGLVWEQVLLRLRLLPLLSLVLHGGNGKEEGGQHLAPTTRPPRKKLLGRKSYFAGVCLSFQANFGTQTLWRPPSFHRWGTRLGHRGWDGIIHKQHRGKLAGTPTFRYRGMLR